MIPNIPQNFPTQEQQVVDKNGKMTQIGRFLLLALWERTGRGTGIPLTINEDDLTATGGTQATAAELSNDINVVYTGSGGGVILFSALQPGMQQWVYNLTGGGISVYPPVDYTMDGVLNAVYALADTKAQIFTCTQEGVIRSFQIG